MTVEFQAGEKIDALARYYSNQANAGSFMTALRERKVTLDEYKSSIITLYPLVVGFNAGLIRSIAKIDELQTSVQARELVEEILSVDHIRHSHRVQVLACRLRTIAREARLPALRALAAQLEEEQEHNDYYRQMLEIYNIDHEAVYSAFEAYLSEIPVEERDRMTREVLTALREGHPARAFPHTSFSQFTLALHHYLLRVVNDPSVTFTNYHALQSGIEFALVKVVSESVFPGVAGTRDHPQLNRALVPDADLCEVGAVPLSIKWWDEHADYGQGGSVELQHVRYGREQLNCNLKEEAEVREALQRVDDVLRLLAAAVGAWEM
jgi:bacterioferritin (cytochrome b1)